MGFSSNDCLRFDVLSGIIAYNSQQPCGIQEFQCLSGPLCHFIVPFTHRFWLSFIWNMKNVKHFFHLKDFSHRLQFCKKAQKNFFIEQNSHSPPFCVFTITSHPSFDLSQVDWDRIVDQDLFYSTELVHHLLHTEEIISKSIHSLG